MSRKAIGERAMTGTERSRRRLQREADHLAMLVSTLKESATQLLAAGKMLAEDGHTITARACFVMAEKALNATQGNPDLPPVIAEPEDPQKKFERERAERRLIRHDVAVQKPV